MYESNREGKQEFVCDVSELIKREPRSCVKEISYYEKNYMEYIDIEYVGGHIATVNVTRNSCGAIFKEIAREVYGEGAHGKVMRDDL